MVIVALQAFNGQACFVTNVDEPGTMSFELMVTDANGNQQIDRGWSGRLQIGICRSHILRKWLKADHTSDTGEKW